MGRAMQVKRFTSNRDLPSLIKERGEVETRFTLPYEALAFWDAA